jgi:hypothetical protein
MFFFGPLVSKAETWYHDSQREEEKSEASLNPRVLREDEFWWTWFSFAR